MADLDPEEVFRDDEDDLENELFQERNSSKDLSVYLVDASPKMFTTSSVSEDKVNETSFHMAVSCISQSLKSQIINRSTDEVAICFFNTREKKNLQDLNGIFVFNVADRKCLDMPTAKYIQEFDCIEDYFNKVIGSEDAIVPGSLENSLYNGIWVAQGLLRKGSVKTVGKNVLLFTNNDDPFGSITGIVKKDMIRTTTQRVKDCQDLGLSFELIPLNCHGQEFNISNFYAGLLGLEGDAINQFIPLASESLEAMKDQLKKRIYKKRKIKRISFSITRSVCIDLDAYALIRPCAPGSFTWLDSMTNTPLKTERTFICADTGSLLNEPMKYFINYRSKIVTFTASELAEIKRIAPANIQLLGFKHLSLLQDYHNIAPSTFLFPSDQELSGSTRVFIALHRSMLRFQCFALAFHGASSNPRLVALIAQEEVTSCGAQVEPPGMHMIPLPYSDDIRDVEEYHPSIHRANEYQVEKASHLLRRLNLKDFSVSQFSNPALQRHYAVLQAVALEEDEVPETPDDTLPDEEGLARSGVVKAIEAFKISIFGENYEESTATEDVHSAARKRKEMDEVAGKKCTQFDWYGLARAGKLKDLTVVQLKFYLSANKLPLAGKKEELVERILLHLTKLGKI